MRLKSFTLILLAILLPVFGSANPAKKLEKHPNFVIINIDDLGWTDLSFMGSKYYETPHIDQLANEGMTFSRAYAAASNCAPSRAALFSGQYAPRTGVFTVANSDRGPAEHRKLIPIENRLFLDDENLTLAEVLQEHGYQTVHIGKWHITKEPANIGFNLNVGGFDAGNPSAKGMGDIFLPFIILISKRDTKENT